MITLKTITTIELSNICNMKCTYCVNSKIMKEPMRRSGIMQDYVFDKTLELLKELCLRGTQKAVNMHGNGESTLDPDLPERIRKVRDVVGDKIPVLLCTNGKTMTEDLAKKIKDAGLTMCDVSPHSVEHARKTVDIFRKVKLNGVLNHGSIVMSHNWAGQLEPEYHVDTSHWDGKATCVPLVEGRGYVLVEGNITPCCYDFRNLGVFGRVFDSDILKRSIVPYELCNTCHQKIPMEIWKKVNEVKGAA